MEVKTQNQISHDSWYKERGHSTDVTAKNKWGGTPLHWAAREGHKEIVELLIAKGADVNAKDVDG